MQRLHGGGDPELLDTGLVLGRDDLDVFDAVGKARAVLGLFPHAQPLKAVQNGTDGQIANGVYG